MKLLAFTHIFGSVMMKIRINTITQIQDKTTNARQDQVEFER